MRKLLPFSIILILAAITIVLWFWASNTQAPTKNDMLQFNGERAFRDIETQLSFGPRYSGSPGHAMMASWLQSNLESYGWQVDIQTGEFQGHSLTNVISSRNNEKADIILGAHYDTRIYADKDPNPDYRENPVPGANDGASGVAVLLEIARVLPEDFPLNVCLVFFDAEDNGNIPGWDWILGSQYFVQNLDHHPQVMVLVDMVGDKDLNIFVEKNSDPELTTAIWEKAQELGYGSHFIPIERYAILDDHIPFLQAGIPSVDIIDFNYHYHHTTSDTIDKVSVQSLSVVGETLLLWLEGYSD